MNTAELLKRSLSVNAKYLSAELNITERTVHKWLSGEQRNPIDRLQIIMDNCESTGVLDYLCHRFGGYFIKHNIDEENSPAVCAEACREFGELISVIGDSLKDGNIDLSEFYKIKKEWNDLQSIIEGFLKDSSNKLRVDLIN